MLSQRALVPPSSSPSVIHIWMWVCKCMCIIRCIDVRECIYIYIHICGSQMWTLGIISQEMTSLFPEIVYPTRTQVSLCRLGWLSTKLLGSLVLSFQCWDKKQTPQCLVIIYMPQTGFRSSGLCGKYFIKWSISLAP